MTNRHYTLKPTYTPVEPSRNARSSSSTEGSRETAAPGSAGTATTADANVRTENEDDDGYDPYSDRREERPLFEQNPWD